MENRRLEIETHFFVVPGQSIAELPNQNMTILQNENVMVDGTVTQ